MKQLWRLERSLLSWLYSLGALNGIGCTYVPRDLREIEGPLRDGTVLAALVPLLCGRAVPGFTPRPRTPAVALANVDKCLAALAGVPRLSRRFLLAGRALARGEREPTLGLLEDCHRAYDGAEPVSHAGRGGGVRDPAAGAAREPYFGAHVPPRSPPPPGGARDAAGAMTTTEAGEWGPSGGDEAVAASEARARRWPVGGGGPGAAAHSVAVQVDLFPVASLVRVAGPTELAAASSAISGVRRGHYRSNPGAFDVRAPITLLPSPPPPPPPPPPPGARTGIPVFVGGATGARGGGGGADASASRGGSVIQPTEEEHAALDPSSDAGIVADWLASLDKPLRRPWSLTVRQCGLPESRGEGLGRTRCSQSSQCIELADGTVLCDIVRELEHLRGDLVGMQREPRVSARVPHLARGGGHLTRARSRPRRCCTTSAWPWTCCGRGRCGRAVWARAPARPSLRTCQNMPMEYLWSEEAIRDGDTTIIVPLLLQVRKAYGHHLKR